MTATATSVLTPRCPGVTNGATRDRCEQLSVAETALSPPGGGACS